MSGTSMNTEDDDGETPATQHCTGEDSNNITLVTMAPACSTLYLQNFA